MNIIDLELHEIASGIKTKAYSSKEVAQAFLDQVKKMDDKINAFITLNEDVLNSAQSVDERLARGEDLGSLAGVPIGYKDMFCTKGIKTTAASKMLENFIPPYSATVVNNLENAGAINLGKLNQDEFAMGSSNEVSHFGSCKNPWDLGFVPGGSSGGSAAAVAARMTPGSLGTDTGGSIRQPASFCGVVGVKPTYGRISRYGVIAFSSSLDQAGPFARSVKDSALMLENMAGYDEFDSTTAREEVPKWSEHLTADLKGVKVGLPKEYFAEGITPGVKKCVENAIDIVKKAGAEIVEVSLPLTKVCVPIYYIITSSEASSNLARYDGVRFGHRHDFGDKKPNSLLDFYSKNRGDGFGKEVKRRIMLGTYALSSGYYDAYYNKSCQVRREIRTSFEKVFEQCDVILSPVSTTSAFKIGERVSDPLKMYMNDIFTTSTNLAGLPGMSVPGGFDDNGMPVGVQITATHFNEQAMFNVGNIIERDAGVKKELPNVLR